LTGKSNNLHLSPNVTKQRCIVDAYNILHWLFLQLLKEEISENVIYVAEKFDEQDFTTLEISSLSLIIDNKYQFKNKIFNSLFKFPPALNNNILMIII
jgi:hypothetical protein